MRSFSADKRVLYSELVLAFSLPLLGYCSSVLMANVRMWLRFLFVVCKPLQNHECSFWTNSMEQSPFCEANKSSDGQEISSVLWNPKFITAFTRARHRSILSQINSLLASSSHFLKIRLMTQ